ncbi:MAG: tetratricopeptide repeat protein [Candidatus Aerophobus sp.]|nr:MAG: tetratricopeptide repeat protein [Candidatus Aerophobus sp.]
MGSRPLKEIIDPKEALELGKNLVFDEKKHEDAIPYFERAIELCPKYIDAWMRKGKAVRLLGISRWNEALACFEQAIQLTQDKSVEKWRRERFSGEAWFEKGKLLNKMGTPEEAGKALREAIKYEKKRKKDGSSPLWYGIGCEFLILGDTRKGQDCFREAVNILDHRIRKHAYGYQDREWLVEDIRKTTECYNKFLEAFSKGAVLASQGKGQEALEYFDRAMTARFGSMSDAVIGRGVGAWLSKGTTLIRLKRYEEALKCFEDTTRRFPFNAKAWLYKGELLNQAGRDEKALESFDRVIQLDPNLVKGWVGKAIVLANLKKGQEALMCIDRAIQLDPADVEILKTKEMIQHALKKG